MKKTGYYLGLLLLVWTVFSCTDEQFVGDSGGNIRVTGTVDTPSRTSYTVGETSVSVSWKMNDEVGLLTEDYPDVLCYQAASDGKETDFMPVAAALEGADGQDVYAYYPYSRYGNVVYPYAPLPYLFGQNYRDGLPDPATDFMYAQGKISHGELNLHFKHLFAFLKLNIRTELLKDAKGLFVSATEPISYLHTDSQIASLNLEEGTIVADKYYDCLWYYFEPEDMADKEIITCYIAILPTSEDNVISIFINDNSGSIEQGLIEKKAPKGGFLAGHIYNLSVNENEFDKVEQQEREALIALYKATGGENWKDNTNWCSDKPLDEWYGVSYWDGHVRSLNLWVNNLTGQIPKELEILTGIENMYLGDNKLEGSIPECIGNLHSLKNLDLANNLLSGEIPSFIGNLSVLENLNLGSNRLEGSIPESIGNLSHLYFLNLMGNNLTGNLPATMSKLANLQYVDLCKNRLSGVIPDEVLNCDWWSRLGYENIIYQQPGYELTFPLYESSDYSMDGTVFTLQNHSVGNGLKVVIMGEAYSDRMIDDGTYRKHVEQAMEAFFSEEPYASFRDYFDVYGLYVVSPNEVLGMNTAFGTSVEFDRGTFVTNSEPVIRYVSNMKETNNQSADVTTIILMNTDANFRANCWMYSDGFCAAFCSYNGTDEEALLQIVHHEACGHGFGKLADEYIEYEGAYPTPSAIVNDHQRNWSMNVDVTNDPQEIAWSYFLTDTRYQNEGIGIFEGANYYPYGIYRATENSIMRYNTGGFNAPSRQSIYRRIMEKSGGVYSFENFLEYDEINRQRMASPSFSRAGAVKKGRVGLPPIRCDYPSSEAKYRLNQQKVNVPFR